MCVCVCVCVFIASQICVFDDLLEIIKKQEESLEHENEESDSEMYDDRQKEGAETIGGQGTETEVRGENKKDNMIYHKTDEITLGGENYHKNKKKGKKRKETNTMQGGEYANNNNNNNNDIDENMYI